MSTMRVPNNSHSAQRHQHARNNNNKKDSTRHTHTHPKNVRQRLTDSHLAAEHMFCTFRFVCIARLAHIIICRFFFFVAVLVCVCVVFLWLFFCFAATVLYSQIRLCAFRVLTMENVFRNFCSVPRFFSLFVALFCFSFALSACLRANAHRWKLFEFLHSVFLFFFSTPPFFRRAIYCLFGLPTTMESTKTILAATRGWHFSEQ